MRGIPGGENGLRNPVPAWMCACKVRLSDDWDYAHVCKDGPVFSGESIVFQE